MLKTKKKQKGKKSFNQNMHENIISHKYAMKCSVVYFKSLKIRSKQTSKSTRMKI